MIGEALRLASPAECSGDAPRAEAFARVSSAVGGVSQNGPWQAPLARVRERVTRDTYGLSPESPSATRRARAATRHRRKTGSGGKRGEGEGIQALSGRRRSRREPDSRRLCLHRHRRAASSGRLALELDAHTQPRTQAASRRRAISDEVAGGLVEGSPATGHHATRAARERRQPGQCVLRASTGDRPPTTAQAPDLRARDSVFAAAAQSRTPRTPSHPAGRSLARPPGGGVRAAAPTHRGQRDRRHSQNAAGGRRSGFGLHRPGIRRVRRPQPVSDVGMELIAVPRRRRIHRRRQHGLLAGQPERRLGEPAIRRGLAPDPDLCRPAGTVEHLRLCFDLPPARSPRAPGRRS